MDYFPEVVQAIPYDDYSVDVYFHDGKIVRYDVAPLISEGKKTQNLFAKLDDLDFFKNTCTVMNGTLAWDIAGNRDATRCLDIDPLTLYELPMTKERIVV